VSRICVIADTHIHPFASFATGVGATNTRVQNSISALQQVHEFCKQNHIETLVHAGDLFHARDYQRFAVFNCVYDQLARMAVDLSIHLIAGNHDIVDKQGTLSLHAFANIEGVEVYGPSTVGASARIVKDPIHHLLFIPYTTCFDHLTTILNSFESRNWCIIGHLDVQGAQAGSAMFQSPNGLALNVLSRFRRVLLGHYHKRQALSEKVYYVGALTPVDFGDVDQEGGFCVLDTETDEVIWHTIKCPRFVRITIPQGSSMTDAQSKLVPGNFIRIEGEQTKEVNEALMAVGVAACEFVVPPKEVKTVARIAEVDQLGWPELVDKYIEINYPAKLDRAQLARLGMELLT